MTTLAAWIEEVRGHLEPERSEEGNQLDGPYTAGAGSISLRHNLGSVAAGAYLSIGTNTLRVWSTNPVAKTAVVTGGWMGSTDADAADGALVRVNPRFTDHGITKALNGALAQMSSPSNGLYKVGTKTLAFDATVQGYDLSDVDNLLRVLEVRRDITGPSQSWPRMRPGEWELQRSAPTADFPSGACLRITALANVSAAPFSIAGQTAFTVQVVYASAFTELATLADDVATTGVPATAYDVPPLGAAIRLMAGREVGRNALNAQGDARRANEVGPGAIAASSRNLIGLWAQRIAEENARLRAQYPLNG